MRTRGDVEVIKSCIHEGIRKMIVDSGFEEDYIEVIVDHKIKDFETLLISNILAQFKPVKYFTRTRTGFTYLSEKKQYEFILDNFSKEPDFFEFMYQMHLQTFVGYMRIEEKHGIFSCD